MKWKIIISEEYESWFNELPQKHKIAIATDLEVLKEIGPTLGRPYVDQIKASKFNSLKELRTDCLAMFTEAYLHLTLKDMLSF